MSDQKRRAESDAEESRKRHCPSVLNELTDVLTEIKMTPSTGEISAELLESMKEIMLQIEQLSNDTSNPESQRIKDESERCLETWLDDLIARCEAEGVLFDEDEIEFSDDDDDALAIALALEDQRGNPSHVRLGPEQEDQDDEDEDEEIIIADEEDDKAQVQLVA